MFSAPALYIPDESFYGNACAGHGGSEHYFAPYCGRRGQGALCLCKQLAIRQSGWQRNETLAAGEALGTARRPIWVRYDATALLSQTLFQTKCCLQRAGTILETFLRDRESIMRDTEVTLLQRANQRLATDHALGSAHGSASGCARRQGHGVLLCSRRKACRQMPMLHIQLLTGIVCTAVVASLRRSSVGMLKVLLDVQYGFPARTQRLIYCGQEMQCDWLLADYGLEANTLLHLVFTEPSPSPSPSPCVLLDITASASSSSSSSPSSSKPGARGPAAAACTRDGVSVAACTRDGVSVAACTRDGVRVATWINGALRWMLAAMHSPSQAALALDDAGAPVPDATYALEDAVRRGQAVLADGVLERAPEELEISPSLAHALRIARGLVATKLRQMCVYQSRISSLSDLGQSV